MRAPPVGSVALHALGAGVVPAVSAILAFRLLVPRAGSGLQGVVAGLGHRYPLLVVVALFLLFSVLGRHWLGRVVGERAPLQPAARPTDRHLSLVAAVVGAACAALLFRALVAKPYRVEGPSMLPTLEPGDVVAGRAPPRASLARGDMLVFRSDGAVVPRAGDSGAREIVKRIVGLPGDRIQMRGATPIINGWPVPACDAGDYFYMTEDAEQAVHGQLRVEFLEDRAYLTVHALVKPFVEPYLVKPGEVFVLGDDRGNSLDSRDYGGGRGGGVPLDAIEARVERFVLGAHRSGDLDFGRTLTPVDALQVDVHLEGVDARALREGIARCLANRPAATHPPPPAPTL